jgi:hypothetical protein
VLRTDNGGEFTAAEFATYYADEGVTRHFSVPYTPQQNRVVEWWNQTVVAMARALLKQRGMLAEFWREAVVTAVYLQNRLTTKSLAGLMPYEAWHSRKLAVSHLRVFGCRAFVKQLGHVDKLADRSYAGIFIGYVEDAKAYRILDPVARQVCSARDVTLDDAHGWDWAATTGMPSTAEFTVDYIYTENSGAAVAARPASPRAPSTPTTPPLTLVAPSPRSVAGPAGAAATPPEFVTPLEDDEERLDVVHGESSMQYRTYDNIVGTGEPMPGLASRYLIEELNLASTGSRAPLLKQGRMQRGELQCRRRLIPSNRIRHGSWLTCLMATVQSPSNRCTS